MTKQIVEAVANTLYHARLYLAGLPIEQQNFVLDPRTNQLVNEAIPILFLAEVSLRNDYSQDF